MNVGDRVDGRFELVSRAGAGGMGEVYRANDTQTGQVVALKVLRAADHAATRFIREARVLCDLRHPTIVGYVAHGEANGTPFLAMEWLEGEDLGQRLKRGALRIGDTVALGQRVGLALATAHARGIVHRDIKPGNVFLVGGQVASAKVLDFGIARIENATRATLSGVLLGTPGYIAPEQARGELDITPCADVFSLGCVLYRCLTGQPAFAGGNMLSVLAKLVLEEPPRVSELRAMVPPPLEDLVHRMLAKSPAARPASAVDVVGQLEAIVVDEEDEPRARPAEPAITLGERRIVSVVMSAPVEVGVPRVGADTLRFDAAPPTRRPLKQGVAAWGQRIGATVEWLADGSMIAMFDGKAGDVALRAAHAAMALRRIVGATPLALATGRGNIEGTRALGQAIDRASELLHGVDMERVPGVVLDDVTQALVQGKLDVRSHAGRPVLDDAPASARAARTILGKRTPFVGRDRELAILESIVQGSVDEGAPAAIIVTGPAGSGKSRLLHELLARCEGLSVWMAGGDPMTRGSSFALAARALRRAFGLREGDGSAVLAARLAEHVEAAELQRVQAFLGEMLSLADHGEPNAQLRAARGNPTLMGDQICRAFADLVLAVAQRGGLLIVLEDLQWGDLPTVRLIDAALRATRDCPLVVLVLARPEVHESFPRLLGDHGATQVRLGALPARAAARLVRDVLGSAADRISVDALVERAAGNPFFLEELMRAVATGRGMELPDTILAIVQERLESLDAEARRVLRAASVFGQSFRPDGVRALVGPTSTAASDASVGYDDLVEQSLKQALELELCERSGDGDELRFCHALFREAAYASLTDEDRALAHRLAGEWHERAGDVDAMALAEHFVRGGAAGRAVAWFVDAAEQALEGHDFGGAAERAARGCDAGAIGEARGRLLLLHAEARRWQGAFADAEQLAEAAVELLVPQTAPWFRAVAEAVNASGRRGDYARVATWAKRLDARCDAAHDRGALVMCLCEIARQLFHAGDYKAADDAIGRSAAAVAASPDIDPCARAELWRLRGARARHVGDLEGDLSGYASALAAFKEAGDERSACNAEVSLGFSYIEVGHWSRARGHLEQALAAAERMGLSTVCTRARQNLGLVLARLGALPAAIDLEKQVITESREQGNRRFEGWTRIYLSQMLCEHGDVAGAIAEAQLARELLQTPAAGAAATAALAWSYLAAGRHDDALPVAAEAACTLVELGGIEEFESLVRLAHAEALEAAGRADEAQRALGVARDALLGRARSIADPSLARAFLEDVPIHSRTVALARDRIGRS